MIQKTLNPKIWDISTQPEKIHPEVFDKLKKISNVFVTHSNIEYEPVDIIIVGSAANINWTEYSDIDLHIITDFKKLSNNYDLVKDYFKLKKEEWNSEHKIKIRGQDVELYVQDVDEVNISSAIYSIDSGKWIVYPDKKFLEVDESLVAIKAQELMIAIDSGIESDDTTVEQLKEIKTKIVKMRRSGLQSGGEMSIENLAFKTLRNNGYIGRLVSEIKTRFDKDLTLEESIKRRKILRNK